MLRARDVPAASFAASAIFLGHALQILDGRYDPFALAWVTLALAFATIGVVRMGAAAGPRAGDSLIRALLVVGIAWQIGSLLSSPPGVNLRDYAHLGPFYIGIGLQALVIAGGLVGAPWMRRVWFPTLLAILLILGIWIIQQSPSPFIDVFVVTRAAIRAALRWNDPYAISFPNIYGPDTPLYRAEVLSGDRVLIGYPYPPLSLLMATPGHWWFGDYRYSHLAALILSAALIGYAQAGVTPKLAGTLFLTTPRIYYILEQGWSEPVAILLLTGTVFCLLRVPRAVPWVAGLFLVVKQYLAFGLPLVWRLASRTREPRRFVKYAVIAALALTVPWLLRHPVTFFTNVVLLQTREPARIDALSYISWAARAGWGNGSFVWAVVAALVGVATTMMVVPNTAAGFSASVGFFCLLMFAFGSKAFANYYFLVIAALCTSVGALPKEARQLVES